MAYIRYNKLFVANCGDCRAVLCRDGKAIAITEDHRTNCILERQRVRQCGGFVTETGRVNGILAVTRSLGDCDLHPAITWQPDIFETELTPNCDFLILACDGLWDTTSNEEAVAAIYDSLDPREAAVKLRDLAYGRGSSDNISVCVVKFSERIKKNFSAESQQEILQPSDHSLNKARSYTDTQVLSPQLPNSQSSSSDSPRHEQGKTPISSPLTSLSF